MGNSTYEFSLDAKSNALFVEDAQGNIATATLLLDHIDPAAGAVTLRCRSPDAAVAAPACSIFTSMRLREDLQLDLRPLLTSGDGPFQIAPEHDVAWQCELRLGASLAPYPLSALEGVLIEQRTRQATRLPFLVDPEHAERFITQSQPVPVGVYDVELHLELESGAGFELLLSGWIVSRSQPEQVSLEITQPGEGASFRRDQIAFGVLGDLESTRAVLVTLRSEVDYPLSVRCRVRVADANNTVPQTDWIEAQRQELLLAPGKPVPLRLTLRVPDEIETNLVDGLFHGELNIVRADTGETIEIVPFQEISGSHTALVSDISFELRRPRFDLSIPYAFGDWASPREDSDYRTDLRVSVGPTLSRIVTVEVRHQSQKPRHVSVLPEGPVLDSQGQVVSALRLVPFESKSTQEIAPGGTGRFRFLFECDADCPVDSATAGVRISSPGGGGHSPRCCH
ncbi:MAG: hypothetical protein R3C18_06965 [Planctomycetaceae bacterium]